MWNNEIHIGIFLCQKFADRDLSHDIVEHRQYERARSLANFSADTRVIPVQFDSNKAEVLDCLPHELNYSSPITSGFDKSKSEKPTRPTCSDMRYLSIGECKVGMKCCDEDGPRYAG